MTDKKISDGLAVIAANYAKRFLEDPYDRLFETDLGEKVKGLDHRVKYAAEFALFVLTAFFEEKLKDDTALRKFVKEVGLDAAPEISKRMINGARERADGLAPPAAKEGKLAARVRDDIDQAARRLRDLTDRIRSERR